MAMYENERKWKARNGKVLFVLKYAAVVIVLFLVILVVRGYMKKHSYMSKTDRVMLVVMIVFYLGFTVFISADIVCSYYLVMLMIGGMLTGGAKLMVTGLMILFALLGLVILIRQVYVEKQNKER